MNINIFGATRYGNFVFSSSCITIKKYLFCPKKGDVIKGTGGARKIRVGVKDKGKRGGARIIYYYQDAESKLWFLAAFKKNKKSEISEHERKLILHT